MLKTFRVYDTGGESSSFENLSSSRLFALSNVPAENDISLQTETLSIDARVSAGFSATETTLKGQGVRTVLTDRLEIGFVLGTPDDDLTVDLSESYKIVSIERDDLLYTVFLLETADDKF